MSKSLGNVVDPVETCEKYGADALRFTLCTGTAPGQDVNLSLDRVNHARNFTNKLWNAGKFVLHNISQVCVCVSVCACCLREREGGQDGVRRPALLRLMLFLARNLCALCSPAELPCPPQSTFSLFSLWTNYQVSDKEWAALAEVNFADPASRAELGLAERWVLLALDDTAAAMTAALERSVWGCDDCVLLCGH